MSHLMWIFLVSLMLACAPTCKDDGRCERECPDDAWPMCTVDHMCYCKDFLDVMRENERIEMEICVEPAEGDLFFSEVMVNGEPTERHEFIELMNNSDQFVRLDTLTINIKRGVQWSERFSFTMGCLPPQGTLLLTGTAAEPLVVPSWHVPAHYDTRKFGFSNSVNFAAELKTRSNRVIDAIDLSADSIEAGVSLVRWPETDRGVFVDHRIMGWGNAASPGRCVHGRRTINGCQPDQTSCGAPNIGEILINEVMVDADPEDLEFVELVNVSNEPKRLNGLTLGEVGERAFLTRLSFWAGCLGPLERIAIYSERPSALASDRVASTLVFDARKFRFANSRGSHLQLRAYNGDIIDDFIIDSKSISENVSLNRFPDAQGDEIVPHNRYFDDESSPGLRAILISSDHRRP